MTLPLTWLLLALLPSSEPLAEAGAWCARLLLLDVALLAVDSPASELAPLLVPVGERTEVLATQAAWRARLLLTSAMLHELAGEPDAARKARDAAEDSLELAMADGKLGREALASARRLLAEARRATRSPGAARSDELASPPVDPDGTPALDEMRAELREARGTR